MLSSESESWRVLDSGSESKEIWWCFEGSWRTLLSSEWFEDFGFFWESWGRSCPVEKE